MRKILSKIAGLILGLSLALGIGVVASGSRAKETKATQVTDTLVASSFAATNTTYKDFSGVSFTSDAVYAGNNGKTSSGGIQLRSKNSSGIVCTASGGTLVSISITVESGSNTLDVYGKTTAYSSAADLYDSSKQGTKIGSKNTTGSISLTNPGNYSFIGLRSNNGALYLTDITVVWDDGQGGSTYSVSYDANADYNVDSTGLPSSHTGLADGAIQTLSTTGPSRWGYSFGGWAATQSSTTPISSVTIDGANATVYAIWTADLTVTGAHASNPYTVAQARTAIDAGSHLDQNYVSGKISQVDSFNDTYKSIQYWISDDGTTTNQLECYSGKGLNGADFSAKGDLVVGSDVVVCGTLKKFNSTYEFDKNNYQVSYTEPVVETTYTVSFVSNGGSVSPASKEVGEGLSFVFPSAGTVADNLFKGWSSDGGTTFYQVDENSPAVDAPTTYTAYWQTKGTSADPYTVSEAMTAVDGNYGLVDAHVSGIVSQVDSYNSSYKSVQYWISDDGTTTTQLECYSGKGLNGADFASKDDVTVGYSVVVCGTLKKYNSTYEFDKNNYQVSYEAPAAPELVSIAISGSLTKTSYTTAESWNVGGLTVTATYDNASTSDVTSSVIWTFYNSSDVEKSSPSSFGAGNNQTLKIKATYNECEDITSETVSVEYVEFVGYTKVTSSAGLVIGDSYVVGVENTNHDTALMGAASAETSTAYRTKVDASDAFNAERTLVTQSEAETAGAVVVTLLSDGNGKYAFYDITNNKYLAGSSSNYFINKSSLGDAGDNAWWTIEFADGLMSVTLNGSTRVLGYNAGSPRFSTYASYAANSTTASNGTVHPVLFRMDGSSVKTSVTSFANTSLKMNDSAYEGDIETENCQANYEAMKEAYIALSDAEKNIFQFASDYSDARARLVKWATANHEVFVYGSETPFAAASNAFVTTLNNTSKSSTIVIVVVALTSITSIGVLLVIKRKRSLVK